MKKFTIVCLSIDPPAGKCDTHILHCVATDFRITRDECEKNHPDFIIVAILPGWHDEA